MNKVTIDSANRKLFLNGVLLKGVESYHFSKPQRDCGHITIQLLADVVPIEETETPKKEKNTAVKIGCDNTDMLSSLDEVEKKLDELYEKANRLKATLSECSISADK